MIRERMERSHTIMAKWIKKLLGLAAIGSAAAGLVYYFKKSKKDEGEDFNDDFEDEDFDLDNDLQPVDREYVDLNAGKVSPEETEEKTAGAVSLKLDQAGGAYPGGKQIFDGLTISAKPGQIIGITGPVACGKSTLGKFYIAYCSFIFSNTYSKFPLLL